MSLVLLCSLLTLCVCVGTPTLWVQVQMVAAELLTFTVRCGFLGPGFVSLVTVSWWEPNATQATELAVLHPEFGVRQWAPARQARWLNESSVSLTLEGAEVQSPQANPTFCCKFVFYPEGSHEGCANPLASSDQGHPAPTPAPIWRAGLAGILGASGVLLLGFVFVLYLLRRWRHWSVTKLQRQPLARVQTRMAALRLPYPTTSFCPAALEMTHLHQRLSQWAPVPARPAHQSRVRAPQASSRVPAPSGFVYVENGLYAGAGARPPHTGPSLAPSPDRTRAMDRKGDLGAQQYRLPD
ncbi:PREDICTED: transmembrane protein PVRIG isoform X2 [Chinchilla lanigera]|uniref:transmembrane protein PVRIG isoform X2 n=1 Tax=Chinchilla lanigera TaxID=34839 RepID=UPI000696DB8B|nr:PREDICTED: transmembrane protein PVRIG isoform X2 [Chinchilla lanigera]